MPDAEQTATPCCRSRSAAPSSPPSAGALLRRTRSVRGAIIAAIAAATSQMLTSVLLAVARTRRICRHVLRMSRECSGISAPIATWSRALGGGLQPPRTSLPTSATARSSGRDARQPIAASVGAPQPNGCWTPRVWAIAQAAWPEEAPQHVGSSAEAPRKACAVIFDVEADTSPVASSRDEQVDQLLGRQVARLQTHGGKAHCLAASRPSCVYVAHVIPSLTCRIPRLLGP